MSNTQTFVWGVEAPIAILEVRHHRVEMLLTVVADVAAKVREKMMELAGTYPNEELSGTGNLSAQFLVSNTGNWNCRWYDLKGELDRVLGFVGEELEWWDDTPMDLPRDPEAPRISLELQELRRALGW